MIPPVTKTVGVSPAGATVDAAAIARSARPAVRASVGSTRLAWPLGVVVALGALLRYWHLDWHLPATLHPDEHNIVNAALRFGTGDLNPHYFVYGSLLMYLTFLGYGAHFVLGWLAGTFTSSEEFAVRYFLDPTWYYLIPRAIVAAAGCVAVALVAVLAWRLHSGQAGVLGAVFMAVYPNHVRESHFALPAVLGGVLVAATLALMLTRRDELGTRSSWAFAAGLVAGLGVSAHVLAVIGPAVLAPWIWWQASRRGRPALGVLVAAGFGTVAGAFLGEPFAFLDPATALPQIFVWSGTVVGGGTFLATTRWWVGDVWNDLGPLGIALACAGVGFAAHKDREGTVLLTVTALCYLVFLGLRGFAPPRYVLLVAPIWCAFAGIGAAALLSAARGGPARAAVALLVMAAVAAPAVQAARVVSEFGVPDTRVLARRWIHAHVPAGEHVLLDGADADVPRLLETPARAAELADRARAARADAPARYRGLETYYRLLGLAGARASEPTYWILRLKHPWWSVTDGGEAAGVDFAIVPPTTELRIRSLAAYRELGVAWVVTTDTSLEAYDNDRYPSARTLYAALRAEGRLAHMARPGRGASGPTVYVWQIGRP